jgi:hypothetical protein
MQQSVVTKQIAEYLETAKACPGCGAHRTWKGQHAIAYRTVFGKLNLVSPRLYDCRCQNNGRHSSSPLETLLSMHWGAGTAVSGDQVRFADGWAINARRLEKLKIAFVSDHHGAVLLLGKAFVHGIRASTKISTAIFGTSDLFNTEVKGSRSATHLRVKPVQFIHLQPPLPLLGPPPNGLV